MSINKKDKSLIHQKSDDAKALVKLFCDKVFFMKILKHIQETLFSDESIHLLEQTAVSFFNDFNVILKNYLLLEISKICDDSSFGKYENISVPNLMKTIAWSNDILSSIELLFEPTTSFRKKIQKARNKILAHNDKITYLTDLKLGNFTDQEINTFFINIEEICNITHKNTHGIIYGEMVLAHSGDVNEFKKVLAKAIVFDKLFQSSKGEDLYKLDRLLSNVFMNNNESKII